MASIIRRHSRVIIKKQMERRKQDYSDVEADELDIKPENQSFLKAIDLGDTSSDDEDTEIKEE